MGQRDLSRRRPEFAAHWPSLRAGRAARRRILPTSQRTKPIATASQAIEMTEQPGTRPMVMRGRTMEDYVYIDPPALSD